GHHGVDRVRREVWPAVDDGGRRRAAGEDDPLVEAPGHDRLVLEDVVAVIEALTTEHVEAGRDVRGWPVLGGVARAAQPGTPGELEALDEALRRVRRLRRV